MKTLFINSIKCLYYLKCD